MQLMLLLLLVLHLQSLIPQQETLVVVDLWSSILLMEKILQ